MKNDNLIQRDLNHFWHPCSQMKDYETFPPEIITHAEGSLLYRQDGPPLIDTISSWWCKSLGHRHPTIQKAVHRQMEKFEHVILANTTNGTIVDLVEKICDMHPDYQKVFFADSGSDTVEVAVKMSLQYHAQTGHPEKKNFLSLENGYHGETILTLALGDCDLYSKPFASLMPKVPRNHSIPYCTGIDDPLWKDMGEERWAIIEKQLEAQREELAAIVFEPLIQGAGGMLIYSADFLTRLRKWTEQNNVHLIADEIMTGLGRAGHARACEWADIVPDFSVFSKGLTAGFCPMAAVVTTNKIYEAFYDDYETGKAFMHSNTYCGNAIAAAAALGAFQVYEEEQTFARVRRDEQYLKDLFKYIHQETGCLKNIRGLGFVTAAELTRPDGTDFPSDKRMGYTIYQEAVKRGALLRPLGNTMYFLPPLNTPKNLLEQSAEIAIASIKAVLG